MVEDLKAKLQEVVLVDGEVPRQFTPSFTIYHKKNPATGSGWTPDRLHSPITACHIQDLTTVIYKQVFIVLLSSLNHT